MKGDEAAKLYDFNSDMSHDQIGMGSEKHKTQAALKCRRHKVSNLKAR